MKKVGGWIALGIGVIAAVFVGINFKSIEASVRRMVMSPEAYYCYVEEQAMERSSDAVMRIYERFLEAFDTSKDKEVQNTLQLTYGDGVKELMKEVDADGLEELDSIGLSILFSQYDNALKQTLATEFLLNETSLLSGELLFDYKEAAVFAGVPEISNQYLFADMETMFGMDADSMTELTQLLPKLYKQLPDRKAAYKLMERYVRLLLENVGTVEKEKSTLKVEGVSQACTELSFYLDVKQMRELAVKVLEEIATDKKLEAYITGVLSELEEIEELEFDADDVYDSFVDGLKDSVDEIKDLMEEGEDEGLEGLAVTVWVDKKGKIIGRKYEMGDEFLFYYGVATKGNDYGFEAEFSLDDEIFVLKGEGSIEKDNVTGTFALDLIEERIATVKVEMLSLKKWKEGMFDGTIILTPDGVTEDLIELWNDEDIVTLKNPQIKIAKSSKEKESLWNISLENDDKLFVEFSYAKKQDKTKKADFPKKEDALKAEEEAELANWVSALDAEALEEKIKAQNVPDVAAERIADYIRILKYDMATDLFIDENYVVAGTIFDTLGDYNQSDKMKICCDAMLLCEKGKYDEALELFEAIEEFTPYAEFYKDECLYHKAEQLLEEEKYEEAIEIFENLRYSYSSSMLEYARGKSSMKEGDYSKAMYHLELVNEAVKDVSEDLKECTYQLGVEALKTGAYRNAYGCFMQIPGYKDADALAAQADEEIAILQAPVGTVFAPNYEDYVANVTLPDTYLGIEMKQLTEWEFQEYLTAHVKEKMLYAMGAGMDVVYEPEVSFSDAAAKYMSNGKYPTEKSYMEYLLEQCEDEKYAPQLREYLATYASVASHDEEYIRKQLSRVMFAAEMEAAQYELGIETYVSLFGYESLEQFKAERERLVRENDTVFAASYVIAKKEGIVITDEDFMKMADEFAYEYGITTDHFLELNDRDRLEQIFMIELAMEYMIDHANKSK